MPHSPLCSHRDSRHDTHNSNKRICVMWCMCLATICLPVGDNLLTLSNKHRLPVTSLYFTEKQSLYLHKVIYIKVKVQVRRKQNQQMCRILSDYCPNPFMSFILHLNSTQVDFKGCLNDISRLSQEISLHLSTGFGLNKIKKTLFYSSFPSGEC